MSYRISLTEDEVVLLINAVTIASEDGSLYGGWEPGDGFYEKRDAEIDTVLSKLRRRGSRPSAPPDGSTELG